MVLKIYGDPSWNNFTVTIWEFLLSKGGFSPQLLPCLAFSNPLPLVCHSMHDTHRLKKKKKKKTLMEHMDRL